MNCQATISQSLRDKVFVSSVFPLLLAALDKPDERDLAYRSARKRRELTATAKMIRSPITTS